MTEEVADPPVGGPDVYFTEGYGLAEQVAGAGEWLDLQDYDGLWRLPVHLREADGLVDAVSPYGYAGLFADARLSDRDVKRAWNVATEQLVSKGVPTLFLRQTPLFANRMPQEGRLTIISGHPTVCVDTTSVPGLWDGMEGRARTSVRKAQRLGYEASVRPAELGDVMGGSPFRSLYEAAMQRRSAAGRYLFPDDYYRSLLDAMGDSLLIAEVRAPDGGVAAASLLLRHGRMLHYHLSGADVAAGRHGATNLGLLTAAAWASSEHIERFHLGGGMTPGDGLFRFKRSMGGRILAFAAYGFVLDDGLYRRSVAERARALGRSLDSLRFASYFPSFRSPA